VVVVVVVVVVDICSSSSSSSNSSSSSSSSSDGGGDSSSKTESQSRSGLEEKLTIPDPTWIRNLTPRSSSRNRYIGKLHYRGSSLYFFLYVFKTRRFGDWIVSVFRLSY
jgi:hypothetical protein